MQLTVSAPSKPEPTAPQKKAAIASSNPYLSNMGGNITVKKDSYNVGSKIDREALKKKLEEKQQNAVIGGKRMKDMSASEVHNIQVQSANKQFANSLVRRANKAADFVSSDDSDSEGSPNVNRGNIMVINIDLAHLGFHTINCFDRDDAAEQAAIFCKRLKLGPKTRAKILELIEEKQKNFNTFKIEYI
jgi:hypothetical protein